MKINLTSIFVDDQAKALAFYTDQLGFVKKEDVPLGEHRWLTVVSPDEPEGTELVLEPDQHPAVRPFKDALAADGIPFASFAVDDVTATFDRLVYARGCDSSKSPPIWVQSRPRCSTTPAGTSFRSRLPPKE